MVRSVLSTITVAAIARGLVALAVVTSAGGCGPIAAGVILSQGSGGSGGSTENTPPTAAITGVTSSSTTTASGEVVVPLRLQDAQGDTVNMTVEYVLPGSSPQPATPMGNSTELTGLATSPGGRDYTFRWNSLRDVGPRDLAGVELVITPFDAARGTSARATFDVQNNEPPVARILRVSSDPAQGVAFVDYLLSDSFAHPSDLTVEFSLDGGGRAGSRRLAPSRRRARARRG